jgi:hypothetical protein
MRKPKFFGLKDGTIKHEDGRLIALSLDRFRNDIVNGSSCFVCCRLLSATQNEEHVIPDWVIRLCGIESEKINLLNGMGFHYSRYKLTCCQECNTQLGDSFEKPISQLFKSGYRDFTRLLCEDNGSAAELLFKWLNLLFLKAHLRDRQFRYNLDTRTRSEPISDHYQWEHLHHIHCIARSHHTNAAIANHALGSLCVLPALPTKQGVGFDFIDVLPFPSVMIRIRDIAVLAMLTDCSATILSIQQVLNKIEGPLTEIQLREFFARMVYINSCLEERPSFYSHIVQDEYRIETRRVGQFRFSSYLAQDAGEYVHEICYPMLRNSNLPPEKIGALRSGKTSFLFNEDGKFVSQESSRCG